MNLVVRGAEIEIDKRIMQEIKDPLIHPLRNCVDHGIEIPKARANITAQGWDWHSRDS